MFGVGKKAITDTTGEYLHLSSAVTCGTGFEEIVSLDFLYNVGNCFFFLNAFSVKKEKAMVPYKRTAFSILL